MVNQLIVIVLVREYIINITISTISSLFIDLKLQCLTIYRKHSIPISITDINRIIIIRYLRSSKFFCYQKLSRVFNLSSVRFQVPRLTRTHIGLYLLKRKKLKVRLLSLPYNYFIRTRRRASSVYPVFIAS